MKKNQPTIAEIEQLHAELIETYSSAPVISYNEAPALAQKEFVDSMNTYGAYQRPLEDE